jgi:hypothetical protein
LRIEQRYADGVRMPVEAEGRQAIGWNYWSSLSSGRAWARSRISSIITDAIVRAFRLDLAALGSLVELEAEQPTMLVNAGQQQLPDGGLNGRFVNLPAGDGVTIV